MKIKYVIRKIKIQLMRPFSDRMWFLLLTYLVGYVSGATWTDPVDSPAGLIRGQNADDGNYLMYLGIPYAKVNEENPFGASTPSQKFEGVFDAVDDSAVCPQQEEFNRTIVGTLDCLHLNVYVPITNNITTSKLPVVVWIHGGYFTIGFAGRRTAGPKFLVRHDIIVVTINYRLGVYGFMCLDTPEVPGNQGLKDQHIALQWVHENIESFGGDAEKITLMGESAGAMSIDFHIISDYPKFYHQVILQSGSGLVPMVILPSDDTALLKIAKHLGFPTDDLQRAMTFLAQTHTDLIIAATLELEMSFRPCVEKRFDNVEQMIRMHPEHSKIPKVNNMTIITGFNSHEQMHFYIDKPIEEIQETFFHDYVFQAYNTEELNDMISKVRRFYIGDEKNRQELIWDLIDFASDIKFNSPVQRMAEKYLENGARVYQYMFSYDGERNFVKVMNNITEPGTAHADELGYLFDIFFLTETPKIEDQLIIDRITTMWANLVKYGNPTPSTSELLPLTWMPATKDVITYLNIDSNMSVGTRPYHARMSFWDLFHAANRDHSWANIRYSPSSSSTFSSPMYYVLLFVTVFFLRI